MDEQEDVGMLESGMIGRAPVVPDADISAWAIGLVHGWWADLETRHRVSR